jgi:hypothetical protein
MLAKRCWIEVMILLGGRRLRNVGVLVLLLLLVLIAIEIALRLECMCATIGRLRLPIHAGMCVHFFTEEEILGLGSTI